MVGEAAMVMMRSRMRQKKKRALTKDQAHFLPAH